MLSVYVQGQDQGLEQITLLGSRTLAFSSDSVVETQEISATGTEKESENTEVPNQEIGQSWKAQAARGKCCCTTKSR